MVVRLWFFDYQLEKNLMNQIQIDRQADQIKQRLNQLIESTPLEWRSGLSQVLQTRVKKLLELYTPVEPQQALQSLLDKTPLLHPRKNWKLEETSYLLYVIDKYCLLHGLQPDDFDLSHWDQIALYLPGRTPEACQFRFLALAPCSITSTPWNSQERDLLLQIIQNQNSSSLNWKLVSEKLYEVNPTKRFRTGKQCREHYSCFLKPDLKKGSWTDEEDYELVCLFLRFGKKWSKMAKHIPGRNENSIKNRFFLMFENRKESRLTNSDLSKVVKRRKEKLEKKIQKNIEDTLDDKILLTSAQSDSFKVEHPPEGQQEETPARVLFEQSEIFMPEGPQEPSFIKNDICWEQSSYEFEKFITF